MRQVLTANLQDPPTAQALLAEMVVTASSSLQAPAFGLLTCAQAVPFQCRITVAPVVHAELP